MAQLSTAAASRIAAEAMSPTSTLAVSASQVVIEDLRIRGWAVADTGASNEARDFDVIMTSSSFLLRARTLAGSALEITQALPGSVISWGANKITAKAMPGAGVALFANGASIDVFWLEQGSGSRILNSKSVDSGSTWGASTAVLTLTTFAGSTLNKLTAPASNMLYFTQGAVVGGGLWLMAAKNTAGTWAASYSNLNPFRLGIETPLATGASYSATSTLTSMRLGGKDLLAFFAVKPLNRSDSGVFSAATFPSNYQRWNSPEKIHATNNAAFTIGTSASGQSLGTEIGFPKLQTVISDGATEYWLTANERISFGGNDVAHFVFFRSRDLVHWKDRQVLAGTDMTYLSLGANTSFQLTDFLYGRILTAASLVYLVGYDRVFYAQATNLCGTTNSTKIQDLSNDTVRWTVDQAGITSRGKGQASIGSMVVKNPDLIYNNSSIIRRGSRITRKMGYITTNGAELQTFSTEYVDKVNQSVQQDGENNLAIESRDAVKLLQTWRADQYHEYPSGIPMRLRAFNDTTFLTGLNGTFFAAGGALHPGMLDNSSQTVDNLAVLAGTRCNSGIMQQKFASIGSMNNSYIGQALQIQSSTRYLAVLFNHTASKFTLELANAASTGAGSNVKYTTLQTSGACNLSQTAPYWLHVQHRKNNILAFWSSDELNWNLVINFSGSEITSMNLPWGFIGRGFLTNSGTLPNITIYATDYADLNRSSEGLDTHLGRAYEFCTRIKTPAQGLLRSIDGVFIQGNPWNVQYVPDIQLALVLDNGLGTRPAATTAASNILVAGTLQANAIITGAIFHFQLTTSVSLLADTYYWGWCKPLGNISTFNNSTQLYSKPVKLGFDRYNGNVNPSLQISSGVADDWETPYADYGGANCQFGILMSMALNSNGFIISEFNFAPDILPKTLEYVTQGIAIKAGILAVSYDNIMFDSASNFSASPSGQAATFDSSYTGTWGLAGNGSQLGGYGSASNTNAIIMQNTSGCKLGDFTLLFDINLLAASSTGGILFRASGAASAVSGYYLSIAGGNNRVELWRSINGTGSNLFNQPTVATYLPTAACVSGILTVDSGYFQLFLDGELFASFFDTSASQFLDANYLGLVAYSQVGASPSVLFSNLRVSELGNTKPYSVIERKQLGKDALERVIGNDRIKYMATPTGGIRFSRFRARVSAGSYSDYLLETTRSQDDLNWISQIEPQGSLFAVRYDAALLDSDERRFEEESYTDATSDFQAYIEAKDALRSRAEQTDLFRTKISMNPTIEREDTLLITNTPDGTSASTFVVNDIRYSGEPGTQNFVQTLTLRKYNTP